MTISHSDFDIEQITCTDVSTDEEFFHFEEWEIQALWRIIQHQYISYEDPEAMRVSSKIMRLVDELAKRNSGAT